MNKLAAAAVLLITLWNLSSCSLLHSVTGRGAKKSDTTMAAMVDTSARKVLDTTHAVPVTNATDTFKKNVADDAVMKQMIEAITPVWKKRLTYKTFSGKAKMRYDGPDQKQEFTAHIRVVKDSVIWINVTALSGVVQVARILITPDSFFLRNDQEQTITRIALKDAAKILPSKVDFPALQNFIIGEPMRDGSIVSATDSQQNWLVHVEDTAYVQNLVYNKQDSTLRSAQLTTHASSGLSAYILYGGYVAMGSRKLSTSRLLTMRKGTETYSLDMNFAKTDFDQPLDLPFSVPDNYTAK